MLSANEAVATFMEEKGLPFVFRVHEPPQAKAVEEFRRFVSFFGYRLPKDAEPTPKAFQAIITKTKGRPEERVVQSLLLRSMKWAKYSAANRGHFGLASEAYTHFTSPIRRYPDLIVHRLLKRALAGKETRVKVEDLASQADHLSQRERVAMEAEREIVSRYRVRFMKGRVGEAYDGVISGVAAFGFFVELREIFVEGLVRVTGLHDDYYQFDEARHCLTGERTHRSFRIGDAIRVRVERVDVERRHIDFGLIPDKAEGRAGAPASPGSRRRRRSRKRRG